MKIILLLCFIAGAFCFAAKDALDAKATYLAKSKHLTLKTPTHHTSAGTQTCLHI